MGGISITQLLFILFIPLALLPTIIALKKNHAHKTPIILLNILGGLIFGLGWLAALIWCFVEPKDTIKTSPSEEISRLHSLKNEGVITEEEFEVKKKNLLSL